LAERVNEGSRNECGAWHTLKQDILTEFDGELLEMGKVRNSPTREQVILK